jgi:hypothetical protein
MNMNSTASYGKDPAESDPVADLAPETCNHGLGKRVNVSKVWMMEAELETQDRKNLSALTSMANLASTHRSDGRGQEAEEVETKVMEEMSILTQYSQWKT